MPRYRFAVEYLGTGFAGWQEQPGQITVQSELEKALAICLRTAITVIGAGRTDSGVHASGQVAHFDCEQILDVLRIEKSVNALTPDSLFIRRLEPCPPDFHARYSAESRRYHYRLALRPTALLGPVAWYTGYPLQVDLFRQELAAVIGLHDFAAFSVPRHDGKSTECHVIRSEIQAEEAFLIVTLEANRFLHRMVRSIVGACFDVSRGILPPGLVQEIFAGSFHGERTWAPAHGLTLEKVRYSGYVY